MPELSKKIQNSAIYYKWYDWAFKKYDSYKFMLGARDGWFGNQEEAFVKELQKRLGIVQDGIFGDRTAAAANYTWPGWSAPPVVKPRRKIWITSSPGSGADPELGPSHDLGERCVRELNLNHEMLRFKKGGYLGFMGGDPTYSYYEVTWSQCKAKEAFLDNNADAQEAMKLAKLAAARLFPGTPENLLNDEQLVLIAKELEFEQHDSGYSQSAEGIEDAAEYLYGDPGYIHYGDPDQAASTGKYRLIRHCLKLIVNFGNPSTPVTGISRKVRPEWLAKKIRNVNYDNDFYAKVPASDKIRPAFYQIIVEAETELPFFARIIRVAIPIIQEWAKVAVPFVAPLLGNFGPLLVTGLSMLNGLQGIGSNQNLGGLLGLAGQATSEREKKIDQDIIDLLKPMGLVTNAIPLVQLVGSLPGLEAHGRYPFDPVKMDEAFRHILWFRR